MHPFRAGHIVRGRENKHRVFLVDYFPGDGMQGGQGINFIPEHFDPDRHFLVHGDDIDSVSAYPERSPGKRHIVAGILHSDKAFQ